MSIVGDQQQAAEAEWLAAWLKGPTQTAWTAIPPQIGAPAPDYSLPDTTGRMRRLSEFWSSRPALVFFFRQFGCSCLAERWEKLRDEVAAFEEAGAQLVAITQGEPERTLRRLSAKDRNPRSYRDSKTLILSQRAHF